MDNLDGATGTVASAAAAGVGVLAAIQGDWALAALVFALAGACLGFLRYNLAAPARIFLGDGGSMPIGFVVAATVMAVPGQGAIGFPAVLVAIPLVGLPVLDTALVMVSRWRRRVSLVSGARDHLTHRLLQRVRSPREVAVALAAVQGGLSVVGLTVFQLGGESALAVAIGAVIVGAGVVAVLEASAWAPERQRS